MGWLPRSPEREHTIESDDQATRPNAEYALAQVNRARACTAWGRDMDAQRNVEWALELGFGRAWIEGNIEQLIGQR